jgi:fatty acid desaturase
MSDPIKINWYRCKVDKAVMSELMKRSDARAFAQVIPQLGLFAATATLSYLLYESLNARNWPWVLPLLVLAVVMHGTFTTFFGGIACHELCHKTPFKTQFWNGFFLRIYAFLGWFDPIGYRASHIRHHQATTYHDHDGEVVLPQGMDWHGFMFVWRTLTFSPTGMLKQLRFWACAAFGNLSKDGFFRSKWLNEVVPESNPELRRELINWARVVLFGHIALAAAFILTGHWFLIVLITFGSHYCSWFVMLCGAPQHVGLSSNVPDFRMNTRTYTSGWLPGFCYWNMQYHMEHHMFPAVPFYNLPRLRKAIINDVPPAQHGLWNTWTKDLLPVLRRLREDPNYVFIPKIPGHGGERVGDDTLLSEAAQER